MNEKSIVETYNQEINTQLLNKETQAALLATTFKGLDILNVKKALLEGMIRGFTIEDFLKKNVYAIPFGGAYSLVTSIDYSRKIAMASGLAGKSAPLYTWTEDADGNKHVETCTVTVQRKVGDHIGDFSATVYFNEYYKKGKEWNGKYTPSMWDNKPMTMIAKVAEMHALRAAFPEKIAQQYVEEELQKEHTARISEVETAVEKKDLTMGKFIKNENNETTQKESEPQKPKVEDAGSGEITDEELGDIGKGFTSN